MKKLLFAFVFTIFCAGSSLFSEELDYASKVENDIEIFRAITLPISAYDKIFREAKNILEKEEKPYTDDVLITIIDSTVLPLLEKIVIILHRSDITVESQEIKEYSMKTASVAQKRYQGYQNLKAALEKKNNAAKAKAKIMLKEADELETEWNNYLQAVINKYGLNKNMDKK